MTEPEDTKAWFSQSVEENLDALFGVACRLTGNRADAEDLVADTVIKAWSAIDSLGDRERFRPWLFRILRNGFISDCRKKSVRPAETPWPDPAADDQPDDISSWLMEQPEAFLNWWANPEQELVNRILGEQLMAAIGDLPEAFRMTVLLVNVDGLTYDEAAEVLGVPAGTVRSRMKRGRTLLQKALWQLARDEGLAAAV